ncbi:MAG: alpha/beta hydrolase, partial [Pseudomonadota bacterium]
VRAVQAEAAHPPTGAFVEVDGARIHYVEMGSGPTVVLLHGAFGSLRDYTYALMPQLADRYRVIAFDRPGLGYSDPLYPGVLSAKAESPAEQARVLAAAAAQLGVEKPLVVGHSFGGIVAYAWALDHDPAAVVSLAGVALPWPGDLGWIYTVNGTVAGGALVAPLISALTPRARIDSGLTSTFAPHPMPDGYDSHIGPYMPLRLGAFRANAKQVNWLRPHVVQMEARYGTHLTLPVEIVHGALDDTVPIAVHSGPLSARFDNVRLTVLEDAGHMPQHSNPDAVIAAIDRAAARAGLN